MMNQYDRQDFTNVTSMMGIYGQYMVMATELIEMFLGWFSMPLEVLIRKDFGERYISVIRFFIAVSVVGLFKWAIRIFVGFSPLEGMLGFVVLGFFIYHRWRIARRRKKGIPWYSMSFGISRFAGLVDWIARLRIPLASAMMSKWDDFTLYRWVEPGICLVVSTLILQFDKGLGFYLLVSTGALFLKNQMEYYQLYNVYLDQIDAQIEAEFHQMALSGAPKGQTAGISVVTAPTPVKLKASSSASKPAPAPEPDIKATVSQTLTPRPQTRPEEPVQPKRGLLNNS